MIFGRCQRLHVRSGEAAPSFNRVVLAESKQGHFMVRLWDSRDLVGAIYRNYERLPAEI